MNEPMPPLPQSVRSLLDDERKGQPMNDAMRARLRARLASSAWSGVGQISATAPTGKIAGSLGAAVLHRLPMLALGFALGAGFAAATMLVFWARPVVIQTLVLNTPTVPATVPTVPAAPAVAPAVAAGVPDQPAAQGSRPARKIAVVQTPAPVANAPVAAHDDVARSAVNDGQLGAERALLERGRTALSRGDAAGALTAAAEHEDRFPRGQLSEEREALRIQALSTLGRLREARQAVQAFRSRFPTSMLTPGLEAGVPASP